MGKHYHIAADPSAHGLNSSAPERSWLSQAQATRATNLSREYLRRLEADGFLVPVVRDGRLVRYTLASIRDAIRDRAEQRRMDRRLDPLRTVGVGASRHDCTSGDPHHGVCGLQRPPTPTHLGE